MIQIGNPLSDKPVDEDYRLPAAGQGRLLSLELRVGKQGALRAGYVRIPCIAGNCDPAAFETGNAARVLGRGGGPVSPELDVKSLAALVVKNLIERSSCIVSENRGRGDGSMPSPEQ